MKLGFVGAGNMAAAMARGWAAAGRQGPEAMLFCDIDASRAAAVADEVGGETRGALAALATESDVLVLAVKPAALDEVATELGGRAPALLSLLAATPLARLDAAFPGVPALRVMPNQPVQVRGGVLCHAPARSMPTDLAERLIGLLGLVGTPIELPEELLDAAMAVMSCSPAYVALFAEALAGGGEREGLPAGLSAELVRLTLAGTAELLADRDAESIRRAVAPPGGATEAGLEALERGGFTGAIDAAVEASLERFR